MTINTDAMVPISEANQNLSKANAEKETADEDVLAISKRLIAKNREAYEVLAK